MKRIFRDKLMSILIMILMVSCFSVAEINGKFVKTFDDIKLNIEVNARFNLEFDANGGKLVVPEELPTNYIEFSEDKATKVVNVDDTYGYVPDAKREGYKFVGWGKVSLPSGYDLLDYIESSNGQYINIGINANRSVHQKLLIDCVLKSNSSTQFMGSNGNLQFNLCESNGFKLNERVAGAIDKDKTQSAKVYSGKDYDNLTYKSTVAYEGPQYDNIPITLFSLENSHHSYCELYGARFEVDDEVVRDFVPAIWLGGTTTYSKNGTIQTDELAENTTGLFDLINGVFYINCNNVNFASGNIVEEKIIESTIVKETKDRSIKANWEANKYKVTLVYNDGQTENETLTVIYDETYANLPIPENKGKTFKGWFDDEDIEKGKEYKPSDTVKITKDTTLYARWDSNQYTITYNPGEGATISTTSKVVTYGEPYGTLEIPTRENYAFVGWSISGLPNGYTQLEYIESDGKQIIDTEVKGNHSQNIKFTLDCEALATSTTHFMGANGNLQLRVVPGNGFEVGKRKIIVVDKQKDKYPIVYAGTEIDNLEQVSSIEYNTASWDHELLSLFAMSNSYYTYCRMYKASIEVEDVLVHDFVPAKWGGGETTYVKGNVKYTGELTEGTAGLYDLQTNCFYIDSNSNDFINGPVIEERINEESIVSLSCDHILHAIWRPIEYKIVYHNNIYKNSEHIEDDIVLPNEYERKLYLESDGSQYINTDVIIDNTKSYEFFAKFTPSDINGKSVWGNQPDGNNRSFNLYLADSNMYFYSGSKVAATSTCKTQVLAGSKYNVKTTIDCVNHKINATVNNATLPAYNFVGDCYEGEIRLMDNAGQSNQGYIGKLYYFEMKENEKTIRQFVPCVRKSDNVIGMYEVINNKFYDNDGSGTFKVGETSDVIVNSENIKYNQEYEIDGNVFSRNGFNLVSYNRKPDGTGTTYTANQKVTNLTNVDGELIHLYAIWQYSGSTQLPEEYEKIEYISTNGNQYIDTGVAISNTDKLNIKAQFVIRDNNSKSLWGNQPGDEIRSFGLYMFVEKMTLYAGSSSARNSTCFAEPTLNVVHEVDAQIDAANKTITATHNGDALSNYVYPGNVSEGNIHLFNNAGQTQYFIGDLYYFEMEKNGDLVRKFIPCIKKQGNVVGLFDIVYGDFYPSDTDTAFFINE